MLGWREFGGEETDDMYIAISVLGGPLIVKACKLVAEYCEIPLITCKEILKSWGHS